MSKIIKLYTEGTPNGWKIATYLELLKVKYEPIMVDISKNEQKEPWFLKLNPNGRIPTLVDETTNTTISESAAIMTYLADHYDEERKFSYEYKTPEYYKQLEITYFQMAGLGPMQGQANHFALAAPEKIEYGIKRYKDETRRLYKVLEEQLNRNPSKSGYLVGDHVSIADIVCVTWTICLKILGISVKDFPVVAEWFKMMLTKHPEIRKGVWVTGTPKVWVELEELD